MKKNKVCPRKKICNDICYGENSCEFSLAFDKLLNRINKLEKEIEDKVRRTTPEDYADTGYEHRCPACYRFVGTIAKDNSRIDEDDYCPSCGQALDWS